MAHKAAGGIKSRQVTERPVRYGQAGGAREMKVAGVSQLGTSVGNHVTGKGKVLTDTIKPVRGSPFGAMGAVKLGNELAGNVGPGGPGTGRTVYRSSTQGQHGAVAGSRRPQGRGILNNE